jgi:hypothetical protein
MNAKKDWIGTYSSVKKFQEGGAMAAPAAPAPGGEAPAAAPAGGDIEAMIAEYAQSRDPQLAVAICDMIVEMMAQGGGAPAEGGAPAPAAKKGMKLKKGPVFKGSCKK